MTFFLGEFMSWFFQPPTPTTTCFTVFVVVITDVHVDLEKIAQRGSLVKSYLDTAGYPLPTLVISSAEEVSEVSLRFFEQGLEYSFPEHQIFQDPWFNFNGSFGWRRSVQRFLLSWLFKRWLVFAYQHQTDRLVFFCHRELLVRLVREITIAKGWWIRYMDNIPGGLVGLYSRLNEVESGEVVCIDLEYDPSISGVGISSVTFLAGESQKCF